MCVCVCVEYFFTTRDVMKTDIDKRKFIEWAEFSGNMYGTRYVCLFHSL